MDEHILEFYSEFSDHSISGNFHRVIFLADCPIKWDQARELIPDLPRGWFELAHLNRNDRIEFTRDFWSATLPYHPSLDSFIERFFAYLDDVVVVITQRTVDDPPEAEIVYSMKDNLGFYRGFTPASEDALLSLQKRVPNVILPKDYLKFLKIHDGFSKATDSTGITSTKEMESVFLQFNAIIRSAPSIKTNRGKSVNPKSLIPFYESFGMPYYQCFWSDWYPENEMGNVYFSGRSCTISANASQREGNVEELSFSTFSDWLIFYLEPIR